MGGLEANTGGGDFGFDPRVSLALSCSVLKSAKRATDLADFIGARSERDGRIQLSGSKGEWMESRKVNSSRTT